MNAIVDNTVNVATVINAAGLTASVSESVGEIAVVSYTLPIAVVVPPVQNINLVTVSGPPGPPGPPGSGSIINLTGQYPIFYDAGSGIVGIVSGYYVTFPDLTSASGALVAQISAASAGVNAINGASGFLTLAAVNPLFVSVAGQTITVSGSGLTTSGDLIRYYLNSNPSGFITTGQTGQFYPESNPQGYATSGFVTGISGALQAMMGSTTGVISLNGTTGAINLTGAGNVTVFRTNQLITISGLNSGEVSQAQLNAFSGYVDFQDATTGRAAVLYASGASGALQAQINSLPTATQLAQTGSDLYRLLTGESGQGVIDYATKTNLALTGSNLYAALTGMSGQGVIDYATKVQLTQSGINLIGYANGIGANLSGNLTQTGILLITRDSSISGVLQGEIDLINAGTGAIPANLVYTSGVQFISGTKYFIGNTYIDNLFVTGQQTIINTQDFYVADNWIVMNATGAARDSALFIATGFTGVSATGAVIGWDVPSNSWRFGLASQQTDLFTLPSVASGEAVDAANVRITSLSGFTTGMSGILDSRIVATGNAAVSQANSIGQTISGNLTITGQTLYAILTGMSGQDVTNYATVANLALTGSNIYRAITGMSGQGVVDYATKVNLALTGSVLYVDLTGLSGQFNTNFATVTNLTLTGQTLRALTLGGDTNLSGNITITGQTLYQMVTGMSGQAVTDYATKTQLTTTGQALYNLIIGGDTNLSGRLASTGALLSAVQVTGSSIINIANFTGLGGTLVIQSGGFIFISGAVVGVGGGVPSVNGITSAVTIAGTGGLTLSTIGQTILISGDNSISGALASTGSTLDGKINSSSGWALLSFLRLTGNQTQTLATNISLSGIDPITPAASFQSLYNGAGPALRLISNVAGNVMEWYETGLFKKTAYFSSDSTDGLRMGGIKDPVLMQLSQDGRIRFGSNDGYYDATAGTSIQLTTTGAIGASGGFFSGLTNLADILYSRSNPQQYVTSGNLASPRFSSNSVSTSFTFATPSYRYIWSGAANCTGTLPLPSVISGIEYMVKNLSSTNTLAISGLVDYTQNTTVAPLQRATFWSDNSSWISI